MSVEHVGGVGFGSPSENRNVREMDKSVVKEPLKVTSEKALKIAEQSGQPITVSEEQLVKAIEKAVKAIQGPYTYLEFSVHEQTKRIAVKVHDRETGEVIREVPPEKSLDFVAKLWEMAGILIDERR
ncbi:flagellar protein FlaG [Paenibacillus sp. TRM 82003]|nr:flagellar protein FlaG [Paenibacillus sp. TRM 82003]MCI3923384.1 flagellar protein FlaG [Paenibacillus sp. TRM 82003]